MDLAQYIEHTLVRSDATRMDITKLCEEAKKFNFLWSMRKSNLCSRGSSKIR